MTKDSILRKLDHGRIFSCEISKDKKTLEFTEECDDYFSVSLTREEVKILLKEIENFLGEME